MDKVYLALETVALTAEKNKLENDCREGASELKTMDVRISHTPHNHRGSVWLALHRGCGDDASMSPSFHVLEFVLKFLVIAAKMQPSGAEEGPADRAMQRHVEEGKVDL